MSQKLEIPMVEQRQQEQPRLPMIEGPVLVVVNRVHGFLGKAQMTRAEHGEAEQALNTLVLKIEADGTTIRNLEKGLADLKTECDKLKAASGGKVVDEVLNEKKK